MSGLGIVARRIGEPKNDLTPRCLAPPRYLLCRIGVLRHPLKFSKSKEDSLST
jgi:hypothetical protein